MQRNPPPSLQRVLPPRVSLEQLLPVARWTEWASRPVDGRGNRGWAGFSDARACDGVQAPSLFRCLSVRRGGRIGGEVVLLASSLSLSSLHGYREETVACLSYTEVLPAPTFPVTTCVRSSLVQGWGPAPRICTLLWEERCSSHRHPCFVDREGRRKARGGQGWPMGRVDWRKATFGGVRLSHMRVPALLGSAKPPGGSQSRS